MATESQAWERMGKDILSDPNNDSLRIRFAALLEEDESKKSHGHARARFIHLQLALARISPSDSQWMRLILEAESLLLDHNRVWMPLWYGGVDVRNAEFHRGFVEAITIAAMSLMNQREEIFTQSPVRHLDIVDLGDPEILEALLVLLEGDGYLDRMVSLRLDGQNIRDEHVKYLDRESLAGLRWLSLANNNIGHDGALILTKGYLSQLEFVDLHGNSFDPVERLTFDQGIVVDRSKAHVPETFPKVSWLERRVFSGLLFQPSRFETIKGFTEEDPGGGVGQPPRGLDSKDRTRSGPTATREDEVGVG
jgi:hypothetical protein